MVGGELGGRWPGSTGSGVKISTLMGILGMKNDNTIGLDLRPDPFSSYNIHFSIPTILILALVSIRPGLS